MNNETNIESILKPRPSQVWRGQYLGLHYQVVLSGVGKINEGRGAWCYYVYLPERDVKDFKTLWLEPRLVKISEESTGFVTYDYSNTAVDCVDWHGGVTFYKKHGEVEGHRCVEFGCDYSHLWDHERGFDYELPDILVDLQETITQLQPLLIKPTADTAKP